MFIELNASNNLPQQVFVAQRDSFDILLRATSQQVIRGPEKKEKKKGRRRRFGEIRVCALTCNKISPTGYRAVMINFIKPREGTKFIYWYNY